MILAVLRRSCIPERNIERIKRAQRDDRLGLDQRPVQTVGRLKRIEAMLTAAHTRAL